MEVFKAAAETVASKHKDVFNPERGPIQSFDNAPVHQTANLKPLGIVGHKHAQLPPTALACMHKCIEQHGGHELSSSEWLDCQKARADSRWASPCRGGKANRQTVLQKADISGQRSLCHAAAAATQAPPLHSVPCTSLCIAISKTCHITDISTQALAILHEGIGVALQTEQRQAQVLS